MIYGLSGDSSHHRDDIREKIIAGCKIVTLETDVPGQSDRRYLVQGILADGGALGR